MQCLQRFYLMFKCYNILTSTLGNENPSSNETSKKNGTVRGDCIACDALLKILLVLPLSGRRLDID